MLVVACIASPPDHPHYGVFTRRQIDSVRALGVPCDVLRIAGYLTPRAYAVAAVRLRRLAGLSDRRYAIVHAHGGEAGIAASAYRGSPLLVSYQGSDLLGSPGSDGVIGFPWRLRASLIRQHARFTTATIVKSAKMLDALPSCVRERAEVIPNGVDRQLFQPRDRGAARAILGWDPDELVILFASDPSRGSKRLHLAQAVHAEVACRLGPVRLEIAHGLAPELMPVLMNASDCLLHPSASEGSPNVVKEALACNLPVVATAAGDIPQLLADVRDSYVSAARVDELAPAVIRCLDPPRRSDGRTHTTQLNLRLIAERIIGRYEAVTGRRLRQDG